MNNYDNLLREIFNDNKYKSNNIKKMLNLGYILKVYDSENEEKFLKRVQAETDVLEEQEKVNGIIIANDINDLIDKNLKNCTVYEDEEILNNLQCDFLEIKENERLGLISYSNVFNPNGVELHGKKDDITSLFTYNAANNNNYENKVNLSEISNKFIDFKNNERYIIIPSSKRLNKDYAYKGYEEIDNNPEEAFSDILFNYKLEEGSIILGLEAENTKNLVNHLYIHDIEEIVYFCPELEFKNKTESFELLEKLVVSHKEDGVNRVLGDNGLSLSFELDQSSNITKRIVLKNNNDIDFSQESFLLNFENIENVEKNKIFFEDIEEFLDKGDNVFDLINNELVNNNKTAEKGQWKSDYDEVEQDLKANINNLCEKIIDEKLDKYIETNIRVPQIKRLIEINSRNLDALNRDIEELTEEKERKEENFKNLFEIRTKEKRSKIKNINSDFEKLKAEKKEEHTKLLETLKVGVDTNREHQTYLNDSFEDNLKNERRKKERELRKVEKDFKKEMKNLYKRKEENSVLDENKREKEKLEFVLATLNGEKNIKMKREISDLKSLNKQRIMVNEIVESEEKSLRGKIKRAPLNEIYNFYRNQVERISNEKDIKIEEIIDYYIDNLYKEDEELIFYEIYDRKDESSKRYYDDLLNFKIKNKEYDNEYINAKNNFTREVESLKEKQGKYILLDLVKSNDIDVRMTDELIQLRSFYKKNINDKDVEKNILNYITANPEIIKDNNLFIDKFLKSRNTNIDEKLGFIFKNANNGLIFETGDDFFKYSISKKNNNIVIDSYFNNTKTESIIFEKHENASKYILNSYPDGYLGEIKKQTNKYYNKYFSGNLLEMYSDIKSDKEYKDNDLELFVKNIGKGKIGIIKNIYENDELSLIKVENNSIILQTIKETGKEQLKNLNSTNVDNFNIENKILDIEELNSYLTNNIGRDTSYSFKKYPYSVVSGENVHMNKNNNKVLTEIVQSVMENPQEKFLNHLSNNIKKINLNSSEEMIRNKKKSRRDVEIFDFENTRKFVDFSQNKNGFISVKVLDIHKNKGNDETASKFAPMGYQFNNVLRISDDKVILTEKGLKDKDFMNLFSLMSVKYDQIYETRKSFSKFFESESNERIIEDYDPATKAAQNINNFRHLNLYHKEFLDIAENGFDDKNNSHIMAKAVLNNNKKVKEDISTFSKNYKELYAVMSAEDVSKNDLVKNLVFNGIIEEVYEDEIYIKAEKIGREVFKESNFNNKFENKIEKKRSDYPMEMNLI